MTLAGARQCMDESTLEEKDSRVTLEIVGIGVNSSKDYVYSGDARGLLDLEHETKGIFTLKCIDSDCQSGDYVWTFYVNGKLMNVGPKQYKINRGDVVSLKLQKI